MKLKETLLKKLQQKITNERVCTPWWHPSLTEQNDNLARSLGKHGKRHVNHKSDCNNYFFQADSSKFERQTSL